MAEQQQTQTAGRARRKTRTGVVTSDKMTKTVTVSLVRRYAHPVEWTWTNQKMRQWFERHAPNSLQEL